MESLSTNVTLTQLKQDYARLHTELCQVLPFTGTTDHADALVSYTEEVGPTRAAELLRKTPEQASVPAEKVELAVVLLERLHALSERIDSATAELNRQRAAHDPSYRPIMHVQTVAFHVGDPGFEPRAGTISDDFIPAAKKRRRDRSRER